MDGQLASKPAPTGMLVRRVACHPARQNKTCQRVDEPLLGQQPACKTLLPCSFLFFVGKSWAHRTSLVYLTAQSKLEDIQKWLFKTLIALVKLCLHSKLHPLLYYKSIVMHF